MLGCRGSDSLLVRSKELVFLLGSAGETQGLEPIDESDGMPAEEPGEEESDDEPSGDNSQRQR